MSTFVVNAGRSAVQTRQEVTRRKRVYKLDRKGCAMKGFFGDIFDFNRDGKLDSFEKAAELLEPGEIDHSESTRNDQSRLIRNSQCTSMTN